MMDASTKSPCDVSTGSIDPYHESDALQGLWRVSSTCRDSNGTGLTLVVMTPLASVRDHPQPERLGRALRAADAGRDVPLNGLMLGGGALLTSAVLLTVASSAEVLVALVPWLVLAVAGVWWLSTALRAESAGDQDRDVQEARVLAAAVELLLRDEATAPGTRRIAADYVMGTLSAKEREAAATRLLPESSDFSAASPRAERFPESPASRDTRRRLPS